MRKIAVFPKARPLIAIGGNMTETNKIKLGDTVTVHYQAGEGTNNPARKLDGQQFIVKRRQVISARPANRVYYELYGAVSEMGVPYGFLEEELIKLED